MDMIPDPEPRTMVSITRHWHEPQIHMHVNAKEIGLDIRLEDFLKALQEELAPARWSLRQTTWEQQFQAACNRVIQKIKDESVKIM